MKITRDIRKQAKTLFRACFVEGRLDEARAREAAQAIAQRKPRGAAAILAWFRKLVELEIRKETVKVDAAVPLPEEGAAVFSQVEEKFGPALAKIYRVEPTLIGGLRIQVGSTVWDGSVRQRLDQLKN